MLDPTNRAPSLHPSLHSHNDSQGGTNQVQLTLLALACFIQQRDCGISMTQYRECVPQWQSLSLLITLIIVIESLLRVYSIMY